MAETPTFRLYVRLEGAAFGEDPIEPERGETIEGDAAPELARILRTVADRIEREGIGWYFQNVQDVNGNPCGTFAWKGDDDQ